MSSGVPQGSVLGPVLFLIYTSDLLFSLGDCYSAYADDIKIFDDPRSTNLQSKLNIVFMWSETWHLPLNLSKCCVLHCGRNNPLVQYNINQTAISVKLAQKDLGVIITNKLS